MSSRIVIARRSTWTLALALLIACGGSGTPGAETRRPDLITRAEITESGASTALEAVERLRPQFLLARGGSSIREGGERHPPQVFVDGLEIGSVEALRDIPASTVLDIRYERNRDTEARLGSGQYGGVIHVRTRGPG